MPLTTQLERATRFEALHARPGAFVIPNPWDAGSARLLEGLGFEALATTSSGFAYAIGRLDGNVTLEETVEHCRALSEATTVPVSADLENGFADDPTTAAQTIARVAEAGVVGGSIEDYTGDDAKPIYDFTLAVERVQAAAEAARSLDFPFMLTARAEGLLRGEGDLDEILRRLEAYEAAGAHVLYAPALTTLDEVRAVTGAVTNPVNVLAPMIRVTRLGYWQESIDTNIRSAEAALADEAAPEALHAMDYMIYGYLQTGQDAAAREVVEQMNAVRAAVDADSGYGVAGFYAIASIQARYALERADWEGAANLDVLRTATPFIDAIVYFARAMGAARSGNPARAREDVAQLARARDALGGNSYWATQVDIQREVAEAWIAFADGDTDNALAAMRRAADREDLTGKSALSPGPVAPARELLGQMLLEAGRHDAALEAFEATTVKEPGRFRGIYGAARAAERLGNRAVAERYYTTLLQVADRADDDGRPELAQARAFIAGH